ncbi:MAG: hypothetical protein CME71_07605 [Halobacteriovorax sp.]|nr:hypothetical protein [Halobacteriovorax sp.]
MRSSLMMSLLRILTPEEINELTTTSEGNKRVPLTQLMYLKMGVETSSEVESASVAKILPFTFPDKDDDTAENSTADEALESPEVEALETEADEQAQVDSSESDEKLQTSVFILVEKKRLENTVHKMRSKDLIKSYKKNASIDLEQEKGLREDMSQSSRSGVLINKKHA